MSAQLSLVRRRQRVRLSAHFVRPWQGISDPGTHLTKQLLSVVLYACLSTATSMATFRSVGRVSLFRASYPVLASVTR